MRWRGLVPRSKAELSICNIEKEQVTECAVCDEDDACVTLPLSLLPFPTSPSCPNYLIGQPFSVAGRLKTEARSISIFPSGEVTTKLGFRSLYCLFASVASDPLNVSYIFSFAPIHFFVAFVLFLVL